MSRALYQWLFKLKNSTCCRKEKYRRKERRKGGKKIIKNNLRKYIKNSIEDKKSHKMHAP